MRPPRLTVPLMLSLAALAEARPPCRGSSPTVSLPSACVGEPAAGAASFCFAPDEDCGEAGVVRAVVLPGAPFSVTGVHVDGPAGTRAVGAGGFPLLLAAGERIVVDLTAVLAAPGSVEGRLAWLVADDLQDDGRQSCDVLLSASAPACMGAPPGEPCAGETCIAGACVAVPFAGACDDGDPCTVGDTCVDGVCRSGSPRDCTRVAGADPCLAGACDRVRGCVTVPLDGPACDDHDPCTSGDRCVAGVCRGQPLACSADAFACTDDVCRAGVCQHVAVDARCTSDECVMSACQPGDPTADVRGCVALPVDEGESCTDDGLACTDDLCTAGGCLHVPRDDRCGTADDCTHARCAPERSDRDARGCVVEASTGDDPHCSEDGDPCTDDLCRAGRCVHLPVPEVSACAPVRGVFNEAVGLAGLARALMGAVTAIASAGTGARPAPDMGPVLVPLGRVDGDLEAAVRALGGRDGVPSPAAGSSAAGGTSAPARARLASARLAHTPGQVRAFLALVGEARVRAEIGREPARALARRGRLLLRGAKTLKGDLKRLQQLTQTFAR